MFLPYGPGIPGMDWELGEKADPLAPAYPGIKPEWYFLWEYQLLKEFPPHLFGLEGPQVCLFVIGILFGIWAIIPWLDRRAYRDKPSPAFSDLAWAAILFLTYLTLMGWDIGAARRRRRVGCDAQGRAGLRMVDLGGGRGGHCCSLLALRTSLVRVHRGGAVAGGAARVVWCFLSARRRDLSRAGDRCHCGFLFHGVAA